MPHLWVSSLGVVPKKAKGEYRLIHYLLHPESDSVNDAIPQELCSVCYTPFNTVVRIVRSCGFEVKISKCDIKSAFLLLPVHSEDFDLLGFHFQGAFSIIRALLMGCSISCAVFECFSSFL